LSLTYHLNVYENVFIDAVKLELKKIFPLAPFLFSPLTLMLQFDNAGL